MGFKKVCVYGFGMNEYFFMMPAIRYVLGRLLSDNGSLAFKLFFEGKHLRQ